MFNNTQGTLESIPVAIRDFYHEETRSEPTGNKLTEKYTVLDEEGQETPAERLVDEYAVVTYVVMNARNDLKTWQDVERVKSLGRYDVTLYNIQKAHENDRWAFHDSYINWLQDNPVPESPLFLVLVGEDIEPEFNLERYEQTVAAWQDQEPVFEPIINLDDAIVKYHEYLAKTHRESCVNGVINVFEVDWQVDKPGRDNINEAIAYAERNMLSGIETRSWILANNTLRKTTVDELKAVMDAYTERLDEVFNAYAKWRTGDKLEPFVF